MQGVPLSNLFSFLYLANVGDAKTLVIHPANPFHIDAEAMKSGGLSDDMIRLSVGLKILTICCRF